MKLPTGSTSHHRENRSSSARQLQRKVRRADRLTLERLEERHLLAIAVGPNINISQRADHQDTGTIAIDRTDPARLFTASNTETGVGFFAAFSTDQGQNWNGQILADGVGDPLTPGRGDVSATFDQFGNLFIAYIGDFADSVVVARSVDGGQTFTQLTTLGFFAEQPTIVTGPGFASPGSVWVTYEQFGRIRVAGATVNGLGLTGGFSAPQQLTGSDFGNFGDIAVGPNGEVLVVYQSDDFFFSTDGPATIFSNLDPDGLGPQPFGLANVVTRVSVGSADTIGPQSNRGVDSEAGLAFDRSGGLHDGRVYMVYTDESPDESDDTDVFVIFSDNLGAIWSAPVRVNDDTGTNSQFLPKLAIDQSRGDVAVVWYDSRLDDGLGGSGDSDGLANTDAQIFASVSSDGGLSFETNVPVSAGPSNATTAVNAADLGAYIGLDFDQGNLFAVWADNSTALPSNPTLPELDLATALAVFQDTIGPFVVSSDPAQGAVVDGPLSFIDFTFSEEMSQGSFGLGDVVSFTVTDTFGVVTDLTPQLTGSSWVALNVLRLFFNTQGPAGDYAIRIGPGITDRAGNPMDQDRDAINGEAVEDQFALDFSISTLVVTSVQLNPTNIVLTFNKAVEPTTVTTALSTCSAADNIFVQQSGGDFAFAGDPGDTLADVCVPSIATVTAANEITVLLPAGLNTDLYRVTVRSGGLTDETPMDNALDGEFDGPPAAGNNNVFPSGDGVVGGDFLYRFITGSEPLRAATQGVLPPVVVTGDPITLPSTENASAPHIAVDPLDPLRMVATWTIFNTQPDPDVIAVQAAYSLNGGRTWSTLFLPGNLLNPATSNPVVVYPEATDSTVAFDRTHNVYLVYSQHTGDYNNGAIVLNKYDFSGSTPTQSIFSQILYQWVQDPAFNPIIAVDNTLASFTDPLSGQVQSNTWSGNVYVAWNTQNTGQANNTNFNPNVIKLIASSDGGNSFGTQVPINDGFGCTFNATQPFVFDVEPVNCGPERHSAPHLVVSQGTADGRVAGGEVTIVWDEFSGSNINPPPRFNVITADGFSDGAVAATFADNNGGGLRDAFDPGASAPHVPGITTFPINVNIVDPRFVQVSDLDVTVNLQHNSLSEMRLRLIPPAQSGLPPIILANNRTDTAGNSNNNIGMAGTELGRSASGFFIGTVFDQDAARSIVYGANPYTGRFQPEESLDLFNGMTLADVNGVWTLEVFDARASTITAPPFPTLFDWSLTFVSGMNPGIDRTVDFVCALGSANGPHVSRPTVSPDRGINPSATIASDNTLGSFSPFQGRLYVTYTSAVDPGPCDGSENDYDIFVATSDDGGDTWSFPTRVSDDHIFDGSGNTRTQLLPTIAVDQVTGTVVTAWLDARDDAANARVATYVSASNDGGQTWSKNAFVNRKHTGTDCYEQFLDQNCRSTRRDLIYGPIPDNQSGGNGARNARFNFGDRIGLVAFDGIITPVWPGNENVTALNNDCCTTDIFANQLRVAAGPRIVDSTMGWVDAPASSLNVTFDRPVDPGSFTADPGTAGSVIFRADFEAANDTITFNGFYGFTFDNRGVDGTAGSNDDGLWHRSNGRGTNPGHSSSFSMYYGRGEGPAGGGNFNTGFRNSGRLISPLIDLTGVPLGSNLSLSFNYFLATEALQGFDVADVHVVVSSATLVASNTINLLDPSLGFQAISVDVSSFAGQQIQLEFSFDSIDAIANNFEGWYVDDILIVDNGIPADVRVFHRDVFGNDTTVPVTNVIPTACNVIGCTEFRVDFAPQTGTGTYYYSVGPTIADRIRLESAVIVPGSTLTQAAVPPQVPRAILDLSVATSTITIASAPPGTVISDVNVNLTITHTCDNFDLGIFLVHPDGTRVTLSVQEPLPPFFCTVNSYTNTTFDDQALLSIAAAPAPFTGSFRPEGALSALNGKAVNGTYRLEIFDFFPPDTGQLVSWSLQIGTGIVISSTRSGNFMDQNANGIRGEPPPPTAPPLFDSTTRNNHDAYLTPAEYGDNSTLPLMITGPRVAPVQGAIRVGVEYTATDPALPRPLVDGGVVESQFDILDHFPITDLDVVVDITGANLADLRVELIRDDNLQTIPLDPTTVSLFDAGDASGSDMRRTIFSDEAATALAPGAAPYRATFRPRGLLAEFDDVPGIPFSQSDTAGRWRLRVTDLTAGGGAAGTLNSWALIVNPNYAITSALAPVNINDGALAITTINVVDSFLVTDLAVHIDIVHAAAPDLDISLVHVPSGTVVNLVQDVAAGGQSFDNTTFDDEAAIPINSPANMAPYRGIFVPDELLSAFDGLDAQGAWQLRIQDDTANNLFGVLNSWTLDFGPDTQSRDHLALHGTANFLDVVFDRDMDPRTFTTVDVKRIIGPHGHIGTAPLGPFRYATLDTTPIPLPIPDGGTVNSTIDVPDSFTIADVDVLVDINHANTSQLHLFLVAPNGQRVELLDNLFATPTPDLLNTIFDSDSPVDIAVAAPPYAGRFRPIQSLNALDGLNSAGRWTLEINDEATTVVGSLLRWNLVLTAATNQYGSAPSLNIPDTATLVTNVISVPDSFSIHDIEVTLNITHPQVQDLDVTLMAPDGTTVTLVANLPATGGNLTNTVFDDEAANVISTGVAPYSATFRPTLPAAGVGTQLSDFHGLNVQGDWTLQIRDLNAGNSTGVQRLNSWSLHVTPSQFQILPNPNGTDSDPNFPRTYRVYFPKQTSSGTYAVNIGSEITSRDGEELDQNRNAGLAALRRGDGFPLGTPNNPESGSDYNTTFTSRDVGTPGAGKLIPEPLGGARRPVTSRLFIPDSVAISDLNIQLTITHNEPVGARPLMQVEDYDVFLISPSGTRLELFSDIGGAGINFVNLLLDDEAERCLKACQPVYVQDGAAPFSDDFRVEGLKPPGLGQPEGPNGLRVFDGENARGFWTLEIIDDTANGLDASLRNWSLQITGRSTGLGEHAADQIATSFRLFVMDPSDPRSSSSWIPVGPANDNGLNDDSSRTGALAVDPSDPTGNTVFVAGATGGVWKTTNFLTTDPNGPTYIPLTDFAPTLGLHIGSIALFPRNGDPKQTVVYVATGEADAGFVGIGFLKSEDGGATWRVQDSLNNDESIPFAARDHFLAGTTTAFKVVVDPTFPDGRVAYAALSGLRGGLYKTVDGGNTWVNTRPGQATDVVLDLINTEVLYAAFRGEGVFISSDRGAQWRGTAGAGGSPTVVNNAQVRDVDVPGISNGTPMPIGQPQDTPSGGKGRISLAKPFLTGDPVIDRAYQGRLYAIVSTPNELFDGAYMTSDFGANWTKLELGRITEAGANCPAPPLPTNNEVNNTDVDPFTLGCLSGQGNYDQAIIADPLNPNRFYVLGTGYIDSPVLVVDVSLTYDGHHYKLFDHNNADGGVTELDTVGGAVRKANRDNGANPPFCEPFACFNGFFDFGGDANGANESRVGLYRGLHTNVASFANNGHETRWSPVAISFAAPGIHVDYHDVAAIVDPLTGKSRLILGTDGGVYSVLAESGYDVNGDPVFSDYFTSPPPSPSIGNALGPAHGSRNGNLQTSQMYGGATQPSQLAAEIATLFKGGGLFYGAFQDNGAATSDPFLLQNGNISWNAYFLAEGDAGFGLTTALADDDSTLGDAYIYWWPCCGGFGSDVIRLNDIPRVTGLDQDLVLLPAAGPFDFAINYRDPRQLLFSGPSGRLYKTDDAGMQWLEIGEPAVFSGQIATAWAFGGEQPDSTPNDFIEPDELIYVGLPDGRLFVSLTEGGDNSQEWFDISAGLFGGRVEDIAPNIRQFSQEAYLVTTTGVFWMPEDPQPDNRICRFPGRADIIPGGNAPIKSRLMRAICDVIQNGPGSNTSNPWQDITGNLRSIQHTVFPGAWNAEGTLGPIVDTLPILFSSIEVDDRYQIPDASGQRSPLVYVGAGFPTGGSGAGVYRTFDRGQSWRRYPDPEIDGAGIEGGFLPNANIAEVELSVGPYDPETGLSDFTSSLDLLVAHTYGRGTFAIRSAPLIFTAQGGLIANSPDLLAADDTGFANNDNITANDGSLGATLRFSGLTHRGATVRLLKDENGLLTEIGRRMSDFFTGDWVVSVGDVDGDGTPDGGTLECGQHVIRAQGISASGTVGQVSDPINVTVLNEPPTEFAAPDLLDVDDTGVSNTDNITRVQNPRFSGATFCGGTGRPVPQATIRLLVRDPLGLIVDPNDLNPATNRYRTVGFGTSALDGSWTVQVDSVNFPVLPDGTHVFAVRAEDLAGNIGPISPTIPVTLDTTPPAPIITAITTDTCAPLGSMAPTPCTFGTRTDLITADQTLFLAGTAEPNSTLTLRFVGGAILGTNIPVDGAGNWSFDHTAQVLANTSLIGTTYNFGISGVDIAGNISQVIAQPPVLIDTITQAPSQPDLLDSSDSGLSNTDNVTNFDGTAGRPLPLRGTAEIFSRVEVFDGATFLGFAIAGNDASGGTPSDGLGLWTFNLPALPCAVPAGCPHSITAVTIDRAGNVSGASPPLSLTIDTIAPATPPSTPDLDPASDSVHACVPPTGTNSDDYTNVTVPRLNGTSEPNGIVTIFEGALARGTAPVGPDIGGGVGNWTFIFPTPLSEGPHSITARATDLAGNISQPSGTLTFRIDTSVQTPSSPDLDAATDSGNSSSDNITNSATLTFRGTSEPSPGNGCVEVLARSTATNVVTSLGFAAVDAAGNWTLNSAVPLADGTYSVTARTNDRAGNVSGDSAGMLPNLVIDRTAPNPPTTPDLTAASDTGILNTDNITRDNTPTFTGSATVSTTVRVFGRPASTGINTLLGQTTPAGNGQWTFTAAVLPDDTYTITATARDVAGNESAPSAGLNVVIDTVIALPAAPDLCSVLSALCGEVSDTGISSTDNITRDNTPSFFNLASSVEGSSTVTVFDGASVLGSATAAANGSWSFTSLVVLNDGPHSIAVRAVDAAGNLSGFSATLNVTIDTVIATPTITGITEDRGPSATDRITNDETLLFQGTAEASSTITFRQTTPLGSTVLGPCPLGSPDVVANLAGNWTFDNTCRPLGPGTFSFSVTATDLAGNTSSASASASVVVDLIAPGDPVGVIPVPTLTLGDDTGIPGDNITRLRRPRLTGVVNGQGVGNIQVQILDPGNNVLGTGTTAGNGTYTVQFANNLLDGQHMVRVRATDNAGNTADSPVLTFTVDGTAPRVLNFTPNGVQATTTSQLVVQLSNDDLNDSAGGSPAFAGSVRNLSNFRLVGNTRGVFDLTNSQFLYDPFNDRITVNLRDATLNPVQLPNDTWRFTIDGTTSLQDIAGNPIDGEFNGTFPSGDGVAGGDFVGTFTINVPPPNVVDVRLAGTRKVVSHVFLSFSQQLNRTLARNGNLYELRDAGRDKLFGSKDDKTVVLAIPECNPLPDPCTVVTLQAIRGFSQNRFFQLTIQDQLSDPGGNRLDGNGDGVAGGNFVAFVGRGRSFIYDDSNGDRVTLALNGGGVMDVVRSANGEGRSIRLERNVTGQSVVPGQTALVGTVTRQGFSDGVTNFQTLTGTRNQFGVTDVNLTGFPRPPFLIANPISAQVVDRLLDSGAAVNDELIDGIISELPRKGRKGR